MWPEKDTFEVTVTVDARLFGRDVAPLRTKVKLKRKPPAKDGGSDGKSKQ